MRSASVATFHVSAKKPSSAPLVTRCSYNPGSTRSVSAGTMPRRSGSGTARPGSTTRPSLPTGKTSPFCNTRPLWPPNAPRVYVDRLPSTTGTSIPPATQRYARAPRFRKSKDKIWPARTWKHSQAGCGVPSTLAGRSAPVTATAASAVKSNSGPRNTISSAAASSRLPTSRLPAISAKRSMAPEIGMPTS